MNFTEKLSDWWQRCDEETPSWRGHAWFLGATVTASAVLLATPFVPVPGFLAGVMTTAPAGTTVGFLALLTGAVATNGVRQVSREYREHHDSMQVVNRAGERLKGTTADIQRLTQLERIMDGVGPLHMGPFLNEFNTVATRVAVLGVDGKVIEGIRPTPMREVAQPVEYVPARAFVPCGNGAQQS